MDLAGPSCLQAPALFAYPVEAPLEGKNGFYKTSKENPFVDSFADPICKLNLKETSEFVKSLPVANTATESRSLFEVSALRREGSVTRRNVEAPPTPGRPIFSFSSGNISRKAFPSKWDDAEKWLISGSSCHESPAHNQSSKALESSKVPPKQCNGFKPQQVEVFAEKSRFTEQKLPTAFPPFQVSASSEHHTSAIVNGLSTSADVVLKDKFTNEVEQIYPKCKGTESIREGFLFGNSKDRSMKDAATDVVREVKHRDVGTEMTPLGSSTTSRCHTPFKSLSPARHNTPASWSGPLALVNSDSTNGTIDIAQLQECHLAKLQLETQFDSITTNWSSKEEEEEDISKSLRHFEISNECRKSVSDTRACTTWEQEEKTKCCLRYQREEAKIQAWVNLQRAKAEAQSRKLEVKIQKMRSNLEEKLMKRMAAVHRKAEEWRAAAQLQHTEQIQRATEQGKKIMYRQNLQLSRHSSCGCFPCNSNHI